MERLDFSEKTAYSATEACIHLNRYAFVKPFCEGTTILDAACGQGYGSYLMKMWGAKEVYGVDIDEETVKNASRLFSTDGLTYLCNTVEQLPFEDAKFDLVVSFETVEHVDDPDAFLKEIKRVLKPGGTVIMSCPNDLYYYENDGAKNPFHKAEYTFFQFKDLAEKHLGDAAEYYFAFALDGFINLPVDKCTEPGVDEALNAMGLFKYEACSSALCVPQERYLNKWNANYYIGVWNGKGKDYRISTVLTPRETFIKHSDKDFDFLKHVDDLKKDLLVQTDACNQAEKKLLEVCKECEEFRKEVNGQKTANARLESLLDLTKRECEQFRIQVGEVENVRQEFEQKLAGERMNISRLEGLLELSRAECEQMRYQIESERIPAMTKRLIIKVLKKIKRIIKKILGR